MKLFRRSLLLWLTLNLVLLSFHNYFVVDSEVCTTNVPMMASIPGNITLGSLSSMFVPGENGVCSNKLLIDLGFEVLEAILFSVDRINANKTLLPNITLGLKAFDTCGTKMAALDRAVRGFVLGETCTSDMVSGNDQPVVGMVGPGYSYQAIHITPFLGLFEIPVISHGATSEELSDKSRYQYFSRTVPSDSLQGKVIVDILKHFKWTYVSIVYTGEGYGQSGFQSIRKLAEKNGICLSTKGMLPLLYSREVYQKIAREVVSDKHAKTVILFGVYSAIAHFLQEILKYEASENLQFIASEILHGKMIPKTTRGILFSSPHTNPLEEFNEYFLNLSVDSNKRNPWFQQFFQQIRNCTFDESFTGNTSLGTICSSNLTLRKTNYVRENLNSYAIPSMIDAVYAFAHALHFYQKHHCEKHLHDSIACLQEISGSDLLHIIRKNTFQSITGNTVNFSSTGDVSGTYAIYFNHLDDNGAPETIKIGEWRQELEFIPNAPTWKLFQVKSQCGEPCGPEEVQRSVAGVEPSCCWTCISCPADTLAMNGTTCRKCDKGFKPNRKQKMCIPIEVRYFTIGDDIELYSLVLIPPIIVSGLSLLAVIFIVVVFIWFKKTPVVQASTREHSILLLVGLILSFFVPFASILKPSPFTCFLLFVLHSLPFNICLVAIAVNNHHIFLMFNSDRLATSLPSFAQPRAQMMISMGLISFQVLLLTLMIFYELPREKLIYPSPNEVYLTCGFSQKQCYLSQAYNAVLLIICTYYAYKTKNTSRNLKEAKYIAFAMYGCCVITVAFVVVAFTTHSVHYSNFYEQTIVSYRATFTSTLLLVCFFGRKVYIVFKPGQNPERTMTERIPMKRMRSEVNERRRQAQDARCISFSIGMVKTVYEHSTQTGGPDGNQYYSTKL